LLNDPLRGNVTGIPTSQNLDTPEGLEGRLSVRIHRIPAELPHSVEPELEKLYQTQMDSSRASMLELLRGLPTSREVLRSSEPRLSLYSTKNAFGSLLGGGGKTSLSSHLLSRGIYWRSKVVLWPKIGHVRPTCQASRPCYLAGRPCFLLALPLGLLYLDHRLFWTRRQNGFWKCANTWPAGHTLGSVEPVFCATSFPRVIFSVTMPYFGHNEDMHGF
jgi:hypothetical protein